ncbi:MAG TPA: ribosome recycling factor, partial [Spirochaetota bacterium]|nr:ribosome recycling factor [Spirochaetota bacterium]
MPDAVQTDLKQKMDKAYQNLLTEYQGMRTGRAHPAMLDNVKVSAYGQQLPVHNVASVTVADARTLKVNVWDGNNLQAVESAIRKADLGVNPRTDGTTIYISLPDLTEERRSEMVKLLKKKN